MAICHRPSASRRTISIWSYDTRNLGPIRTLSLGVEETQIGNEMLLIVTGKNVGLGGLVGN
jgi:hypothetical protein